MKHDCKTCPLWHALDMNIPGGVIINKNEFDDRAVKPDVKIDSAPMLGECLKDPPLSVMLPMQGGGVDPRAITFLQKPYYPHKFSHGPQSGCSHHPSFRTDQVREETIARLLVEKNWLEYNPSKYKDLDGLSRIPKLSELNQVADTSQRAPDETPTPKT